MVERVEIFGIEEKELEGFLHALSNLYNSKTKFYESGINLLLSNELDSKQVLFITHLYTISTGIILLFVEYLKDLNTASFKIHAFRPFLASQTTYEFAEKKLKETLEYFKDKDMKPFALEAIIDVFICPNCNARYSSRILRMRDDGYIECQNCGKYVFVRKSEDTPESQSVQV
ncbi:MAG: hypothetical protein JW779_15470 [Candidatus Thorarchaeota archaeon]|nr:hypothetical protein [Candidatus Thorarchaeota archaeon]